MTRLTSGQHGWSETTLLELCDSEGGRIQTGPFGSQLHADEYTLAGVPVINPTHLAGNRINHDDVPRIPTERAADLARHVVRTGDILFARRGEIGRLGLVGQEESGWVCGTGCFLVRVEHPEINNEFLAYYFASAAIVEWLSANAAGTIMPNLNTRVLGRLPVAYPSLDEQGQIAAVLAAVDGQRVRARRSGHVLRTLKETVMRSVFAHGLRSEPQKDTEIGLIPASWDVVPISEICEIFSGGTPSKSVSTYWTGDIPWVSGKDLKQPELTDVVDHISADGLEAGSRLAPRDAVLLLVRGMGLAKDLPVAVLSRAMAFNQDIKALVSRGRLSGTFIRSAIYQGKERLLSRIVPSAHGTMTLNLYDVQNFKVACPLDPLEVGEIVAVLDAIDQKIDVHQRKRAVLEDLFKALLHKLMTGEIRVADLDLSALQEAGT